MLSEKIIGKALVTDLRLFFFFLRHQIWLRACLKRAVRKQPPSSPDIFHFSSTNNLPNWRLFLEDHPPHKFVCMSVCLFLSVSVSSPLFPSPTLSSPLPFPLPLFPILILHIMYGMTELPQELFSSGIVKLGQITLLINLKKECLCE